MTAEGAQAICLLITAALLYAAIDHALKRRRRR